MKKLKNFFGSIVDIFEGLFLLSILIFGYPFYQKPVKEMIKSMKDHKDNNKY